MDRKQLISTSIVFVAIWILKELFVNLGIPAFWHMYDWNFWLRRLSNVRTVASFAHLLAPTLHFFASILTTWTFPILVFVAIYYYYSRVKPTVDVVRKVVRVADKSKPYVVSIFLTAIASLVFRKQIKNFVDYGAIYLRDKYNSFMGRDENTHEASESYKNHSAMIGHLIDYVTIGAGTFGTLFGSTVVFKQIASMQIIRNAITRLFGAAEEEDVANLESKKDALWRSWKQVRGRSFLRALLVSESTFQDHLVEFMESWKARNLPAFAGDNDQFLDFRGLRVKRKAGSYGFSDTDAQPEDVARAIQRALLKVEVTGSDSLLVHVQRELKVVKDFLFPQDSVPLVDMIRDIRRWEVEKPYEAVYEYLVNNQVPIALAAGGAIFAIFALMVWDKLSEETQTFIPEVDNYVRKVRRNTRETYDTPTSHRSRSRSRGPASDDENDFPEEKKPKQKKTYIDVVGGYDPYRGHSDEPKHEYRLSIHRDELVSFAAAFEKLASMADPKTRLVTFTNECSVSKIDEYLDFDQLSSLPTPPISPATNEALITSSPKDPRPNDDVFALYSVMNGIRYEGACFLIQTPAGRCFVTARHVLPGCTHAVVIANGSEIHTELFYACGDVAFLVPAESFNSVVASLPVQRVASVNYKPTSNLPLIGRYPDSSQSGNLVKRTEDSNISDYWAYTISTKKSNSGAPIVAGSVDCIGQVMFVHTDQGVPDRTNVGIYLPPLLAQATVALRTFLDQRKQAKRQSHGTSNTAQSSNVVAQSNN